MDDRGPLGVSPNDLPPGLSGHRGVTFGQFAPPANPGGRRQVGRSFQGPDSSMVEGSAIDGWPLIS